MTAEVKKRKRLRFPDIHGYFGSYGGKFVPETLVEPLDRLELEYQRIQKDASFWRDWRDALCSFCGRPTPLYFAKRFTEELGGARIYFKREDLLHTGAHKINNAVGQTLLAKRMGKHRVVAETG